MKTAVSIIGMHRSGTSSVSRLINLLGVYIGNAEDLYSADDNNPEGFWELIDIVELHDKLLMSANMSWDTPVPVDERLLSADGATATLERIREIVVTRFSDIELWGWKDPRTCLFLPLWKRVLKDLGVRLKCIYVLRDPNEVAMSLFKRNGFSRDKSVGIWLNYNLSALASLHDVPTLFVSYDALFHNLPVVLERLCNFLGFDWPMSSEIYQEIYGFIKPSLRHNIKTLNDKTDNTWKENELYNLLKIYTKSNKLAIDYETINNMNYTYSSIINCCREDVINSHNYSVNLEELKQLKCKLDTCENNLLQSQQIINSLNLNIDEKNEKIANFDSHISELNDAIKNIHKSVSWQFASPIRALQRLLAKR